MYVGTGELVHIGELFRHRVHIFNKVATSTHHAEKLTRIGTVRDYFLDAICMGVPHD